MTGTLKRIGSQTVVYGISSIVGRFLNYLLVPLYTRVFVPEEYGIVTELYAWASFLGIALTYGMETAYFRFSSESDNEEEVFRTANSSLVLSSLSFLVLACIIIPFSATSGIYAEMPQLLYLLIGILAFDALSAIPFARLRKQEKPFRFAGIKLLNICLNILLNLWFYLLGPVIYPDFRPGVEYIFIANALAALASLILLNPFSFNPLTGINKILLKQMLQFAWPLLFAGLAGMVNETLDRIVMRGLLPTKDALFAMGIYGACYKLSMIMTLFIQAYRYAIEPFFFAEAGKNGSAKTHAAITEIFSAFCALIMIGTLLYLPWLKNFIGHKYHEGLHIVPVLLLANWFLGLFFNVSLWYKNQKKTAIGMWLAFFGAAITITLNILLIPLMGYAGAAWTTLIAYVSMFICSLIIGRKNDPANYRLGKMVIPMVLAICIAGLCLNTGMKSDSYQFLLNTGLFILCFLVIVLPERRNFRSLRHL